MPTVKVSPVLRLPTVTAESATVTVKPSPAVRVITLSEAVIGMSAVAGIVPLVRFIAETSLILGKVEVASTVKASLAVTLNSAPLAVIGICEHSAGNSTLTPSTAILLGAVACSNE